MVTVHPCKQLQVQRDLYELSFLSKTKHTKAVHSYTSRDTMSYVHAHCLCQDQAQIANQQGFGVTYNPNDPVQSAVVANVQVRAIIADTQVRSPAALIHIQIKYR